MSGEHSFLLSPKDGGTLVVQSETFCGLLVPFSGKTLARAEASFQELNRRSRSVRRPTGETSPTVGPLLPPEPA
jgi:hypothetical protein